MINLFNIDDDSNFQYMLDSVGRSVTVNKSTTPIMATITNTKIETNYDDRKISTIDMLERGDMIDYNNKKYMVISEINDKRYGHYKGVIRHLPHEIIFSSSCVFESVYAYIDSGNPSFKSGNVLTLIQDKIVVYLPNNTMDLHPTSGDEFMIQGSKFNIITNDTYSQPGIAILTCERTQINPTVDDVEHNIANGLACPLTINNSEPVTMILNNTLQLTWGSVYDEPVEFTSSDINIATVDSQGLVSGLNVGLVTITIINASNGYIYDTVNISVEDIPVVKTIEIASSKPTNKTNDYYNVTVNTAVTFTATVYDGVNTTSDAVTFELFADDKVSPVDTSKYTSTINGNATVITAKATPYYMQLKATLTSDPSIFTWQGIRIKSLF